MSYSKLLIHKCDIMRRTYGAVDVTGQPTETWSAVYTAIKSRFVWQIGFLGVQGAEYYDERRVATHQYIVFLPKDTVVRTDDRIINVIHKSGTVIDNGPFNVEEARVHSDSKTGHHIECMVRRLKAGGT